MRKGSKHTKEAKKKMSEAWTDPIYRKKMSKKMSETMKGRPFTEEHRKKLSEAKKGKLSPMKGKSNPHSQEHRKKLSEVMKGKNKGKICSEETRKKISKAMKGKNWKGGVSFLPYPPIFNNELKQFVKDRDNNECQNPYCRGNSKRLTSHHIDFNKDNCSQFNLITLCVSCNSRANNKYLWQRLYKKIVWSKYE